MSMTALGPPINATISAISAADMKPPNRCTRALNLQQQGYLKAGVVFGSDAKRQGGALETHDSGADTYIFALTVFS
jgi:hypothetical protein